MKKLLLLGALLPCFTIAQQVPKGLTVSNGKYLGFYQYTPPSYHTSTTRFPLIIFLHGIGERGNGTTELYKVKSEGIPKYIEAGNPMTFTWNGRTESFVVLSPQCSSDTKWYLEDFHVREMIRYAKKNLRIDTNRIFLTGLSMGGGGVWKYASDSRENASSLAGIGVVCGACVDVNGAAIRAAGLPVWAFHAQDDSAANARIECTIRAVDNIRSVKPNVSPVLTIYPDGNHFIWDRAYDTGHTYHDPNIYQWFLAQDKKLPANKLPTARAGHDVLVSRGTESVILDASASADPDGDIIKTRWRFISGPQQIKITDPDRQVTSVKELIKGGNYQFEVRVIDDRAGWAADTIEVRVRAGILSPAAEASFRVLPSVVYSGSIHVSYQSESEHMTLVTVIDAKGVVLRSIAVRSPTASFENAIDISALARGIYYVKLTGKRRLMYRGFVKTN